MIAIDETGDKVLLGRNVRLSFFILIFILDMTTTFTFIREGILASSILLWQVSLNRGKPLRMLWLEKCGKRPGSQSGTLDTTLDSHGYLVSSWQQNLSLTMTELALSSQSHGRLLCQSRFITGDTRRSRQRARWLVLLLVMQRKRNSKVSDARWFSRSEIFDVLKHEMAERTEGRNNQPTPHLNPAYEDNATKNEPPFRLPAITAIAGVLIRDWLEGKIGFMPASEPKSELILQRNNL